MRAITCAQCQQRPDGLGQIAVHVEGGRNRHTGTLLANGPQQVQIRVRTRVRDRRTMQAQIDCVQRPAGEGRPKVIHHLAEECVEQRIVDRPGGNRTGAARHDQTPFWVACTKRWQRSKLPNRARGPLDGRFASYPLGALECRTVGRQWAKGVAFVRQARNEQAAPLWSVHAHRT